MFIVWRLCPLFAPMDTFFFQTPVDSALTVRGDTRKPLLASSSISVQRVIAARVLQQVDNMDVSIYRMFKLRTILLCGSQAIRYLLTCYGDTWLKSICNHPIVCPKNAV
jgi:hypothetical protein